MEYILENLGAERIADDLYVFHLSNGKMLEADEQSISLEDLSAEPENLMHAADLAESKQAAKNTGKKEKKKGFLTSGKTLANVNSSFAHFTADKINFAAACCEKTTFLLRK